MERDTRRTWGVIAVLAVVALIGWGIWAAMDTETRTGTGVDDDEFDVFDNQTENTTTGAIGDDEQDAQTTPTRTTTTDTTTDDGGLY